MSDPLMLRSTLLCWGCAVLLFLALAVPLAAQQWTPWERDHAVAQHEDWLVLKEPGRRYCYLKQSYDDPRKMELSINEQGQPVLWGGFAETPVDLDITCQVDTNQSYSFTVREVTNALVLPQGLVDEMRRGFVLTVTVSPRDPERELQTVTEQAFSLEGLMDASDELESETCQKN